MKTVEELFDRNLLVDMDYQTLLDFKTTYLKLLQDNPFPLSPNSTSFYEMIIYLKRKNQNQAGKIGAYKNITVYEASNRIATDLVSINGLLQLLAVRKELQGGKFTLRLGTTFENGKGKFTIKINNEEIQGEAFNVASSSLQDRIRNTFKKWKGNQQLKYILVNADAFEFKGDSLIDERVIRIENWHK